MIVDKETFTELAVHLKLTSDAILKTARHLAVISNDPSNAPGHEEHWQGTLDALMAMNTEVTFIEKLMRALLDANQDENRGSETPPPEKNVQ